VPDRRILIEREHPELSIREQCALLEVNRSSFYTVKQSIDNETLYLLRIVDEVYTKYPFFGTRQMSAYLKRRGHALGRGCLRRLYKLLGIEAIFPKPKTSVAHPAHFKYPYLLRGVEIIRPDHVWSTDITYIRLAKGFVYLVAIIDWYSRYVLDWELSISLEATFCIETLLRVLSWAQCDIFNTDQGAQFTSHDFTSALLNHNIQISMDGKGRALDNVFVERLWRSVKYECVYLKEWDSVNEIRRGLKDYFQFYNDERPHQALDFKTPREVYFG